MQNKSAGSKLQSFVVTSDLVLEWKPVFTVHAKDRDHALVKLEALRGTPLQPHEALITYQEYQDEARFMRECISHPMSDDQLFGDKSHSEFPHGPTR